MKQIYLVSSVLMTLALIGGGCWNNQAQNSNQNQNNNANVSTNNNTNNNGNSNANINTNTNQPPNNSLNQTYTDNKFKVAFEYPVGWILPAISTPEKVGGVFVQLRSPEMQVLNFDQQGNLRNPGTEAPINDVTIWYFKSLNTPQASGENDRTNNYTDLPTFFRLNQNLRIMGQAQETTLGRIKAYEYISEGSGGNQYIIWVEANGFYKLSFNRIQQKSDLSDNEKMIINTFRFIK